MWQTSLSECDGMCGFLCFGPVVDAPQSEIILHSVRNVHLHCQNLQILPSVNSQRLYTDRYTKLILITVEFRLLLSSRGEIWFTATIKMTRKQNKHKIPLLQATWPSSATKTCKISQNKRTLKAQIHNSSNRQEQPAKLDDISQRRSLIILIFTDTVIPAASIVMTEKHYFKWYVFKLLSWKTIRFKHKTSV